MLMRATAQELKTLIPDPAKGAMAVDIIRLGHEPGRSDDANQRKRWSKYWAPNDRCAVVYWETAIVPPAVIDGSLRRRKN